MLLASRDFWLRPPGVRPETVTALCIGPETARRASAAGMRTYTAGAATVPALVALVQRVYEGRRKGGVDKEAPPAAAAGDAAQNGAGDQDGSASLIYPAFVAEGIEKPEEIASMPGQYRHTLESLLAPAEELLASGVDKMMLFGVPLEKDEVGSRPTAPTVWCRRPPGADGPFPRALPHRRRMHV